MNSHLIRYLSNKNFTVISLLLSLILFDSCVSIKPSSTKSGRNYYETFYVGEDGTQYFIKPLLFETKNTSEYLFVDFTFRYKNEVKDSVIVNFSFKSASIYKSIESIKISNENVEVSSNNIELLFNETFKSGYTSRFTTKFSLSETKELFNQNEWIINITNQTSSYWPHRKTRKAISSLKDGVFILM